MSKFTAKVTVSGKTAWGTGTYAAVALTFVPDYMGGRNAEWAAATPSLGLNMTVKPEIADLLEIGDSVTLTFEKEPVAD